MTAKSSAKSRLALRDLAAGAAFTSMAVSGVVPIWATLGFALGLALALLDLRVLSRHAGVAAALLGFAALGLYASVAVGKVDLVLAACTFAALITLFRMLAAPDRKTDGQVYLTSILMLSGGSALSADILFAASLAAFAALSMVSIGMGVVERAAGAGEALPGLPLLRQLALGAVAALLGSVLFFAAMPRFSWNVAGRRPPGAIGTPTIGFSDHVSLMGSGRIKTDPRIVARVKIAPDPAGAALEAYWLGRTFDTFNGREWLAHGVRRMPRGMVVLKSSAGKRVNQGIELLPAYGSKTLIALESPIAFTNAIARTGDGTRRVALIEVQGQEVRFDEPAPSYTYDAESVEPLRDPKASPVTGDPRRYLQVPQLDPRVAQLARAAARDATDPLQTARRLERYLKSNYRYVLELPGDVGDPLVNFLFAKREGHCEQFATALTVMLRTLGIPARLATGFFGGERIGDHYVLRAGDAHAWTQLVLPDGRIVSLDATPDASRPSQAAALLDWFLRGYETLSERWRTSVVDYSLQDQEELTQKVAAYGHPAISPLQSPRRWMGGLIALSALSFLAWGLVRARRRKGVGHEATVFLEAAEKILHRAGVRAERGECFEDVAHRLAASDDPLSTSISEVAHRYLQARFGRRPLAAEEGNRLLKKLAAASRAGKPRADVTLAADVGKRAFPQWPSGPE